MIAQNIISSIDITVPVCIPTLLSPLRLRLGLHRPACCDARTQASVSALLSSHTTNNTCLTRIIIKYTSIIYTRFYLGALLLRRHSELSLCYVYNVTIRIQCITWIRNKFNINFESNKVYINFTRTYMYINHTQIHRERVRNNWIFFVFNAYCVDGNN